MDHEIDRLMRWRSAGPKQAGSRLAELAGDGEGLNERTGGELLIESEGAEVCLNLFLHHNVDLSGFVIERVVDIEPYDRALVWTIERGLRGGDGRGEIWW